MTEAMLQLLLVQLADDGRGVIKHCPEGKLDYLKDNI